MCGKYMYYFSNVKIYVPDSVFATWMYGVRNQSDCTFYASSDAITNNYWSRGSSGVPSNWVIAEYQPPANR